MTWRLVHTTDHDEGYGALIVDEQGRRVAEVFGWDGISMEDALNNARRIVDAVNALPEGDDACDDDPDGQHHVGCGCEVTESDDNLAMALAIADRKLREK